MRVTFRNNVFRETAGLRSMATSFVVKRFLVYLGMSQGGGQAGRCANKVQDFDTGEIS